MAALDDELRADDSEPKGHNVRRLQKENGWSQEQFAEAAQLTQVSISGIEHGVLAANLNVLDRLAESLGAAPVLLIEQI
ncbi:helix-turn-helix domain-containing protein [Stagnimonas aquatica]|uniref:helix-turn-helix domain-containing protein n=1 Tax=Stagnimonas aquatica TaxID=2689987 RepID=UPI0013159144|nr:helix-turn-helix transcriptional regulator [Stagnimonas aquatica]